MCRSSQPGNHQFALPNRIITAGHEQAADDRGVDRDRDREADAELLDGRVAVEDEAREDGDHDQSPPR